MAKEKKEFDGCCPECGGTNVRMVAASGVSVIYDLQNSWRDDTPA